MKSESTLYRAELRQMAKQLQDRQPISLELLTDCLSAMHWVIAPYIENDSNIQEESPWIYELAIVYNKLLDSLNTQPIKIKHDFEYFNL